MKEEKIQQREEIMKALLSNELTTKEIMAEYDISRSTLYRIDEELHRQLFKRPMTTRRRAPKPNKPSISLAEQAEVDRISNIPKEKRDIVIELLLTTDLSQIEIAAQAEVSPTDVEGLDLINGISFIKSEEFKATVASFFVNKTPDYYVEMESIIRENKQIHDIELPMQAQMGIRSAIFYFAKKMKQAQKPSKDNLSKDFLPINVLIERVAEKCKCREEIVRRVYNAMAAVSREAKANETSTGTGGKAPDNR